MYFRVNEFEVGVIDSIFSGNEQQKVYPYQMLYMNSSKKLVAPGTACMTAFLVHFILNVYKENSASFDHRC